MSEECVDSTKLFANIIYATDGHPGLGVDRKNPVFRLRNKLMKQRQIFAAIAVAFGATVAAQAGTLTAANTKFAVENFGSTFSSTTGSVTPGVVTYTVGTTNGIVVNSGGKLYFTVRLVGAVFNGAGTAAGVTGVVAGSIGAPTTALVGSSADGSTAVFAVTYPNGATLGVGSTFTYTPAAGDIIGVKSTLSTVGASISASGSLSAVAVTLSGIPNSTAAQASDVDGPVGTANIATASQAISLAVSSLSGYGAKIDLTASPVASVYTETLGGAAVAPSGVQLGSVTATNAGTAPKEIDGATPFNLAAADAAGTPLTIVVTPAAGQAFPVGSTVSYSVTPTAGAVDACATANQLSPTAAMTVATSTQPVTLSVAAANVTSTIPVFVCVSAPGAGKTAAPITATLAATLSNAGVPNAAPDTATGTGYALTYNGSSVTTNTYFPVAIGQFGYSTYTRVVNTGSIAAPISAAFVDGGTGLAGTSAVIISSLPAGAAVLLPNSTIEAALGVSPVVSARPRLQITAPTNRMTVQSYVQSANGTFSEVSSSQGN